MSTDAITLPDHWFQWSGSNVLLCNMAELTIPSSANWLSESELRRLNGISQPDYAALYLQSRCILRSLIGTLTLQSPQCVSFSIGAHGKPQLQHSTLQFNLSHSNEWLAIAISTMSVGIDIENARKDMPRPWLALAKRFFTQEEHCFLSQLNTEDLPEQFFRLWTQKEAVLKTHGGGISAGLKQLNLRTAEHSLNNQTYRIAYCQPAMNLHCAICLQTDDATAINFYNLNEKLEIEPLQPPYIDHLCLKPNSL
jgi:4'-phosphopantetheinyl transferase